MFFFAKDYNPVGKEINSKHKNQKLVEAMGRTTLSYPRSMGSILIISLAHSLVGIFISFAPKVFVSLNFRELTFGRMKRLI